MSLSVAQGFTKSLAMTVLSEIGDKTFFAAAILAMRHPRRLVLSGCLTALIVMTILSAVVGWAAPNLIVYLLATFKVITDPTDSEIFRESEELAEVEAKLDADWKANNGSVKERSKADDDLKKERRQLLTQFFSPIFLKAFSITFFGEWGDKSQLATIGLAADENPFGVVLGGILGQALCTTAAVLGGKSLASQISEKFVNDESCPFASFFAVYILFSSMCNHKAVLILVQVAFSGGVLFIIFGIQSFLSSVGS
ncbi:hypothetical protein RHMOL_Rhmol09G0162000 [Rhododendron molle]|uniref:Uncharacterized protein n=1 Tax=Rhododendron molle TaxID=49168 RepID=A0ACC0MEK1_RHOML|nr:hypothetical protein RHMOL_Rhmol09G0162000 [Rhododendron molle]